MLLQLDSGIFYEFITAEDFLNNKPNRITIADVKLDVNYVMIISTNAGLWGYNIGDTVMFKSLNHTGLLFQEELNITYLHLVNMLLARKLKKRC